MPLFGKIVLAVAGTLCVLAPVIQQVLDIFWWIRR
jgi:hypothetical protein